MKRASAASGGGRFVELDGLRGIAVIMVLFVHYSTMFDIFFPGHRRFPVTFYAGGLGVQLFFMISGFVIFMTARRRRTAPDFSLARALRLYPTYWVCLTITIVAVYGAHVAPLGRSRAELAANYTMLQAFVGVRSIDGAYWSLSREIIFYGLIAVSLWLLGGRLSTRFVTAFVTTWSLIGLALCYLDSTMDSSLVHLAVTASAGQYAALFGLGMVMFEVREGSRRFPPLLIVLLAGIAVGAELLLDEHPAPLFLIVLIGVFVATAATESVPVFRWRPLTWVGSISYPLYLLHQNIGYIVILRTVDRVGPYGSRILAVLVSLLLAWAVHATIETRLTRVLGERIRHRKPVAAVPENA
ncbi:acyltransferase family protein [Calidifontibacter terrae]